MKGDELRDLQAPLKSRYRETPDAALITLKATGELGDQGLTCKVETGRALVEAGLHPATGGDGKNGLLVSKFIKIFGFHSFVYLLPRCVFYALRISRMPASRLRL